MDFPFLEHIERSLCGSNKISITPPPSELFIGGVSIKHQIEPQITHIYEGTCELRIKRMVAPIPLLNSMKGNEVLSFKLTSAHGCHIMEGECRLHSCTEHGSSDHYRVLEDVLLEIRPK